MVIAGNAAVAQHIVLTRPDGRVVRVDLVRTDGELMYTGTARAEGPGLTFSIADVARPEDTRQHNGAPERQGHRTGHGRGFGQADRRPLRGTVGRTLNDTERT